MRYVYQARHTNGVLTKGSLEAQTRDEAVQKILRDGLFPVDVEVDNSKKLKVLPAVFLQRNAVTLDELGDFLQSFSDLIAADIALVRALHMVEKRTTQRVLRKAIDRIIAKVQDGMALSSAMATEPKVFPSYWSGLIRAGEVSGRLKDILQRLSHLVDKERETKSRLISAAAYPALILVVGLGIVFALMTFVVPKLTEVFSDMGQKLPFITQLLLFSSNVLSKTWWMWIAAVVLFIVWFQTLVTTASGRLAVERNLYRVVFWGEFLKIDDMERLARTIGTLLESGVETVTALECGAQTLKSETLKLEMIKIIDAVRSGVNLSKAFGVSSVFPEDVVGMIGVGEEAGRGYQGFLQWAEISDRRLERMAKLATALLEPSLILFLGAIFGFIVMAMLLPIFNMSFGVN